MNKPDPSRRNPYWLWRTKRLFPHPLFAGCISFASLLAGILFAGVAIDVPGCWPMAIPSLLFFMGSFATAAAVITSSEKEHHRATSDAQIDKPTFAIFVQLIGVYSWALTLAMHVFNAFFKNGPGSIKYYVTLGIAVISTLFMQLYGKRVVRQHFGPRGGRNLELNSRQAVYIAVFVVFVGIFGTWVIG